MSLSQEAKQRDGHTCQKCGRVGDSSSLHSHHIHPSWAGGEDTLENLVTLCPHCHRFAPESSDETTAKEKTAEYVSTGVRPEFDLFLFGVEYGSRMADDDEVLHAKESASDFEGLFDQLRNDDGDPSMPKRPEDIFNILFSLWKSVRSAKGDCEYWAASADTNNGPNSGGGRAEDGSVEPGNL